MSKTTAWRRGSVATIVAFVAGAGIGVMLPSNAHPQVGGATSRRGGADEVPLNSRIGQPRLVIHVTPGATGPQAIAFFDANGNFIYQPAERSGAPAIDLLGSDGKQDASQATVEGLQRQIDSLQAKLNEAIERINALSQ